MIFLTNIGQKILTTTAIVAMTFPLTLLKAQAESFPFTLIKQINYILGARSQFKHQ